MAKPIRARKEKKGKLYFSEGLPLTRDNYRILGVGLLVIVAGYAAMLEGSVEGILPLVVSPILLVIGYCVVIPIGILYKKAGTKNDAPASAATKG